MSKENFKQDFSEEEDFDDFASDLNENINDIRTSTDRFFKRKLILFCIRWTLTFLLLYFFMDNYPWIKYLVYAAIPLGILNLVMIFVGRKKLNEKLTETENKINSI